MLQIGQRVRIEDEPSIGYQYFDNGDINTYDWVAGIRMVGVEPYYQLVNEDYDCFWAESELQGRDKFLHNDKPSYDIGDELLHDDGTLTTDMVTGIIRLCDVFKYKFGNKDEYIPESELKLYRKRGSDAVYTLF